MALRLPPELVRRARELAAGGAWEIPACRPAATVVLLRDDGGQIEVLLMRRPATMAFAPGMHVFPGGRVDPESDARCPFVDVPDVGPWVLGPGQDDPEGLARAIVAAGVRETFEEAGVLLAVDGSGRYPAPDAGWAQDRVASDARGAFPDILRRRGLGLSARLLIPFAHWVTPEVESRRYDTRFLLAAAPAGTHVAAHDTETESAVWLRPGKALADYAAGSLPMLPPTVAVLERLAGFPTVDDAARWAAGNPTVPLMPRPVVTGHGPEATVEWVLVNAYTGEVLGAGMEPRGSEVQGVPG